MREAGIAVNIVSSTKPSYLVLPRLFGHGGPSVFFRGVGKLVNLRGGGGGLGFGGRVCTWVYKGLRLT